MRAFVLQVMTESKVLFGIELNQINNYIVKYPDDRLWTKLLVAAAFLNDLLTAISNGAFLYSVRGISIHSVNPTPTATDV